jgi:proteasome subunit beta type-3
LILDPKTFKPHVSEMDLIGNISVCDDFAVSGTSTQQIFGMCETVWKPDMEPDELFEAISQALMSGMDRDAASGWGGFVYIIEKSKVTIKSIKTRMD